MLSLTNPSLVPTEMLACGLPVVDLASAPMLATFGADGPIELAAPDPRDVPNNHLSYAVQWFLFALTAVVIYILALRKRWGGSPSDTSRRAD